MGNITCRCEVRPWGKGSSLVSYGTPLPDTMPEIDEYGFRKVGLREFLVSLEPERISDILEQRGYKVLRLFP